MRSIYLPLLASGTTIATLLSLVGSLEWRFALLEHARPQYCLALLVVLLIGLINRKPWRKKRWMLLWLIPLWVNLSFLLPVLLPAEAAVATQNSIGLNLLHVTLDHQNSDASSAIAYINQQAPDLLSVLEVTPQTLPQLQSRLANYQLVIAEPRANSHGSAWFVSRRSASPIRINRSALIHLPAQSDRPLLTVSLTYAGRTIDLLCFHVIRPRSSETVSYQRVELAALAQWSQQRQQEGSPHLVVIGDFNSTPWYSAFRQMLRESGLVNSQNGFGLQPSWHSSWPSLLRIPIDHCLHSRTFVTVKRQIGQDIGSDHFPLWVSLRFSS